MTRNNCTIVAEIGSNWDPSDTESRIELARVEGQYNV